MPGAPRPPGLLRRLARLLVSRNPLRRPSDRIEGVVLIAVLAGLLAAAAAGLVLGGHVYRQQRAGQARLHPVTAVLSQNGPGDSLDGFGQARARWRAPDGRQRAGLLNTVTAPGIWNAPAGTRVRVWVTRSGAPATPPNDLEALALAALAAAGVAGGGGVVLIIWYWLCRLVLDRQRLRAWESAWAATGPRWTRRH
jgi:hypothetical protein